DPDWVAKAAAGLAERIIPCIGCVQDSRGHTAGAGISCAHNPASGREQTWGPIVEAASRRRVVVVGAGPAGLEAARVAALRGHDVSLLKRDDAIGGQMRLAATVPSRAELDGLASFRREELARLQVRVACNVDASWDTILALEPDAVVVAT